MAAVDVLMVPEVCFTCPCNKQFKRKAQYDRHMDMAHSSGESHKCNVCGKTFGNVNTLTMHMSVHQENKVFAGLRMDRGVTRPRKSSSRERQQVAAGASVLDIASASDVGCTGTPAAVKITANGSSVGLDLEPEKKLVPTVGETDSDSNDNSAPERRHSDIENEDPQCRVGAAPVRTEPTVIQLEASDKHCITLDTASQTRTLNGDERRSVITFRSNGMTDGKPGTYEVVDASSHMQVQPSGHSIIIIKTDHHTDITDDQVMATVMSLEQDKLDEEALIRKSKRIKGKLPGWKSMIDNSVVEPVVQDADDMPMRRRKIPKLEVEAEEQDNSSSTDGEIEKALLGLAGDMHCPVSPSDIEVYGLKPGGKYAFKCAVCDKGFTSEKYLSMHMALHRVGNPMDTLMSTNNKEDEDSVARKVKGASREGSAYWTCKICNKSFAQNSNYKNHIRTHSDERPFVCEICSIGFKERYHLKKHMLFKHSNELKEECRYCGKKFKDSTAVRAHERIHSDLRPYACRRCGKTFKTSECLWHHENRSKTCGLALLGMPPAGPRFRRGRRKEGRPLAPGPAPGFEMQQSNAPLQPTQTISISHIPQSHMALGPTFTSHASMPGTVPTLVVTSSGLATANPCTTQYTLTHQMPPTTAVAMEANARPAVQPTRNHVISHMAAQPTSHLSAAVVVKVEPELALTDYELTAMASDTSFDDNFAVSMEEDILKLKYESIEEMDSVVSRLESGELPPSSPNGMSDMGKLGQMKDNKYTCDTCGKHFMSEMTFDKHLVTHTDIRPYNCEECDIAFKLKVHLKKHNLYRHSNEYPCECSICGKRFKDTSAVRLHERIHSEKRPYQCDCGKSFKTRENLWVHRHRGPCEKNKDLKMVMGPGEEASLPGLVPVSQTMNAELLMKTEGGMITNAPPVAVFTTSTRAGIQIQVQQALPQIALTPAMAASHGAMSLISTPVSIPPPAPVVTVTAPLSSASAQSAVMTTAPVPQIRIPVPAVRPSILPLPKTTTGESWQALSSGSLTPVGSLPTAVVAPIKRQVEQQKPMKKDENTKVDNEKPKGLPPFATFSPTIRGMCTGMGPGAQSEPPGSKTLSIADRCPTIQKYLLQSVRQPVKLPGIQQLFQSHSLSHRAKSPSRSLSPASASSVPPFPTSGITTPTSSLAPSPMSCSSTSPRAGSPRGAGLCPTSPFPGVNAASLSLLFGDPNLASAGREIFMAQSPQDTPTGQSGIPVIYWDDEADRKNLAPSTPWQSESESLFNDLSNSGFGNL